MSEPIVTVVIVTYNSVDTIGAALDSLAPARDAGLIRCVVVDNISRDDTTEFVRRGYGWVTLVENDANLGYGRGCNAGLERADSRYIMFMNPDATMDRDAIRIMVSFLDEHERCAMVAPAIVEGDTLQGCGALPTPWKIVRRAAGSNGSDLNLKAIEPGAKPFQTDWLCGAILVTRTDLMKRIGGFDPRIFLYFDETDLCKRLLDEGWELWAVGEAVARHDANASAAATGNELVSGCIAEHYFRSRFYYLCKHNGRVAAICVEMAELLLLAVRTPLRWIRGRGGMLAKRLRSPVMRMPRFPRTDQQ